MKRGHRVANAGVFPTDDACSIKPVACRRGYPAVAGVRRVRPIAIYPDISVEVAFQHLLVRPPFDDIAIREEFRERLNRAPGVEISASRLNSRPPIAIEVLGDEAARREIDDALAWFFELFASRDRSTS